MWTYARRLVMLGLLPIGLLQGQAATELRPLAGRVTGTPELEVRRYELTSAILGESRTLGVLLPPSYHRTGLARRYPVIVVLDGETQLASAAAAIAELTRNGMIPEAIVVGIENTSRIRDLTPPGMSVSGSTRQQGGDRFLAFIQRELLPAIDNSLRGDAPRILVGHSSGGILATFALAVDTTFHGIVAIDTPVQLDNHWLLGTALSTTARAGHPVRYAAYQAAFAWPDSSWNALVDRAPARWNLHREVLEQEGHETVPMLATYLGLRHLFADYSRLAVRGLAPSQISGHYREVGVRLGAPVVAPRRVLAELVHALLAEGQASAAREAYDQLVAGYGSPSDSGNVLARIAAAEQAPAPTETVAGLLGTPFPTPQDARRFLGDWRGDQWFMSAQPRTGNITLRLRVENGRVVGEVINPNAPADFRTRRVEYLKVTAEGLTWGFLNRMEPRGVMLHEGVLRGDTLSGRSRFGGVVVNYPPGEAPDPGFRFVRVSR